MLAWDEIVVTGEATYFDFESETTKPIVGAEVQLEFGITPVASGYTDENGVYSIAYSLEQTGFPMQITTRLYFSNGYSRVVKEDVAYQTSTSDMFGSVPEVPGYMLPPYSYGHEMSTVITGAGVSGWNNAAKVFEMSKKPIDFALSNEIPVGRVTIDYPANINSALVVNSFFWPYDDVTLDNVYTIFSGISGAWIINLITGIESDDFNLTSNTIYLVQPEGTQYAHEIAPTLFHEYGHYVHKSLNNDVWVLSVTDYMSPDQFPTHNHAELNQTPEQAFIEGFANFYGGVVESIESGNQYSGSHYNYPTYYENRTTSTFPSDLVSGYTSELAVAMMLFDLYDPIDSGDADLIQISLAELFTRINILISSAEDLMNQFETFRDYPKLAPLFYSMNVNKMAPSSEHIVSYSEKDMNSVGSYGENYYSSMTFEDSENSILLRDNSINPMTVPTMKFINYTLGTTKNEDNDDYFNMWNSPGYYHIYGECKVNSTEENFKAYYIHKETINFVNAYDYAGNFEFRDPWNMGSNAPSVKANPWDWEQNDTFIPILNLTSNGDYEVFLDQNNDFDEDYPIYQAKVLNPMVDINGTTKVFGGWVAKDIDGDVLSSEGIFLTPNSLETKVVFTDDVASIEPIYFELDLADNIDLTYENNQFKVKSLNRIYATTDGIYEFDSWTGTDVQFSNPGSSESVVTFIGDNPIIGINSSPSYVVTIHEDEQLVIPPGANYSFPDNSRITNNGTLSMIGTKENPIVIESSDFDPNDPFYTPFSIASNDGTLYLENIEFKHVGNIVIGGDGFGFRTIQVRNCKFNDANLNVMFDQNTSIQPYRNVNIVNNTFIGGSTFITQWNTVLIIVNNIFYNHDINLSMVSAPNYSSQEFIWTNSLYNCSTNNYSSSNDILDIDPLFLDFVNGDLHLSSSSTCIDNGAQLHGAIDSNHDIIPLDPDGTDPDIGAYYYPQLSGTFSEDIVIEGEASIGGDFTLSAGNTMTVIPGTAIIVAPNAEIIIKGILEADASGQAPITFRSTDPVGTPHNTATRWDGISVKTGGVASIDNIVVSNAHRGVRIYDGSSSANVNNSSFEDCYYAYYVLNRDNVSFTHNTVNNTRFGLYFRYSDAYIAYNTINGNENGAGYGSRGIYGYQSHFTAVQNNLSGYTNQGMYLNRSNPYLNSNEFSDCSYGMELQQ